MDAKGGSSDSLVKLHTPSLPLAQSLILVWPQVTSLIAGVIVLFVAAYIVFQRQEVRA